MKSAELLILLSTSHPSPDGLLISKGINGPGRST
jgi:hypothetical protein